MDVVKLLTARHVLIINSVALWALLGCGKEEQAPVAAHPAFREVASSCSNTAVDNRFLVRWKDGSFSVETAPDRETFIQDVLQPNEDEIEFAENDQIVRLENPLLTATEVEDSPDNWGQDRVEAASAWAQGIDGRGVTVAVVDSGVDLTHPQLLDSIAVNANEIANGIDDDGNGLIDDIYGYDFEADSDRVYDKTGHGTHVAGIIGANHSTGTVQGIAPQAKILPLDFMNDQGAGSIGGAIAAIQYAVERGVRVINASWGGRECSESLRQVLLELEAKGVLFVAAAGNSGFNLDYDPEFPAAFRSRAQLTVGATSTRDIMAAFSNYSYSLVHLSAPGVGIVSTYPDNRTRSLSGTSMATPFVSGAAALLMSVRPQATVAQIREAILRGVDRDPSDPKGVLPVLTGGRLNIRKSLDELRKMLP